MQPNHFFSLKQIIDRQPLTVTPETSLTQVLCLMQEWDNSCNLSDRTTTSAAELAVGKNNSCVLITNNNKLCGIFTERNLVKLIAQGIEITDSVTVSEVMSQNVVTLTASDSEEVFTALNLLRQHRIRHLPVVDNRQQLIGLITAKNLRQKLQPISLMQWRKVSEIMKTEVVHAAPDCSVRQVAKLMADRDISCVAIAESKLEPKTATSLVSPVGIITERDIVQFQNLNLDFEQPVRNLMSSPLFLVTPEDSLWSVHQQMQQRRVRRLLVVGRRGELRGIITQTSLLQVLDPTEMYGAIEVLQRQVCQLEIERTQLLENRQRELENQVQERTAALETTNQRLQLEASLRQESERRFDSILNSLEDVVYSVAPDTFKLLYISSAAEKVYGRQITEFYDNSDLWLEMVHPEDRDRVSNFAREVVESETSEIEYRIVRPNGEVVWLYERTRLILNAAGTPVRLDGIATDISDRKQAEAALRESEQLFRNMADNSPMMVWVTDATGYCSYVSQSWCEFTGQTEDTALGFGWLEAVHPQDRNRARAIFLRANERQESFQIDYRLRRHDGKYRWAIDAAKPLISNDGQFKGYIGSVIDISDRKEAELEIRKFVSLADNSSEFIGMCDLNFVPFYINKTGKKLIGLDDLEQYNKVEVGDFFFPEDRDFILNDFFPQVMGQGQGEVEIRFRHFQTGEAIWMIYSVHSIEDENGNSIALATLSHDISDRKRREEILKDIASGISIEIGENFLASLVEYLSKTLKVDYAYVGKLSGSEQDRLRTLAVYSRGKIIDNFEYELTGTPCLNVIEGDFCIYPETVQQLFPQSLLLPEMSAESFAGMPIIDAAGNAVGLIAIIDSKPFENVSLIEEVLTIFVTRVTTELERQRTEENLQQSNQILQAISSIQTQFLTDAEPRIIFDVMLEAVLELTQSEYGFIGEILIAADGSPIMEESYMKFRGRPYLKTHAITNIAWNEETRAFYAENAPKGMEFHNLQTLFGAVIVTGEPVIANSPSTDPRRGGLPDGHPPLNAFLGVPFYKNDKMTGMVGIANREGGYDEAIVHYLRPLLDTCSRIIEAYKSERQSRQAEQKIRQQAALLDVANDAIMVRGLDDRILFWNQGAEKLYGWTKAEALNRDANELFNRESLTELNKIQQAVREHGEWQGELNHVTKAGNKIVVQSRWTLVKDDLGDPQAYLVVKTDVTEQKQLEAQLLRTQRLESLGTLAGGIAHDLNNILAPILGFSKLLPHKLPDLDEQTKGFFKIMETNAQRGTALVKQILTFARGLEGDRGIVQIRHLISEIEQIIDETFPKTIDLEINVPKNLWTVNGDVNQLHQVLMNLAVNARDAMPDGGKLTIMAENFTVNAGYARLHIDAAEGLYIVITVADTGVGIPAEIVDRIFEPFFTTKEIGRGTGLGLSTAIGIVKSHQGFIEVISDRGQGVRGTQFKVFLPASETAAATSEPSEEIPQGNGELILVVDDENSILAATKAVLETYNYRVLTASNGIDAIAIYARDLQTIDLAIVDIMLPSMNGKTAIRTLKKINPEAKIIAVSGLISSQEIIAEINDEIVAYLAKPYTNEELLKTIKEVLPSI